MFNLFFSNQNDQNDYDEILTDIKNDKAQLIDIREKNEWDGSHFKGAVHIPLSGLSKGKGIEKLKNINSLDKKIYLHCRSGSRVQMAKRILNGYGCDGFSIIPISMSEMTRKGFRLAA